MSSASSRSKSSSTPSVDMRSRSWSLTCGPSSSRPRRGVSLVGARDLEQLLHPLRRPRPPPEPVHRLLGVDLHRRGLGPRVIRPEHLDEPSVARRGAVCRHHPVGRLLLLSHSHEPELDGHFLFFLSGAFSAVCLPVV